MKQWIFSLCSQRYLGALLHFEPVLFAEVRFWYHLINCSCMSCAELWFNILFNMIDHLINCSCMSCAELWFNILFNMIAVQRSVQRAQAVQPRDVVCRVGACSNVLRTHFACVRCVVLFASDWCHCYFRFVSLNSLQLFSKLKYM